MDQNINISEVLTALQKQNEAIETQALCIKQLQAEIVSLRQNNLGIKDKNSSFIIYGGGSHAREMHYNLLDQGIKKDNINIYDNDPCNSWCQTKAELEVKPKLNLKSNTLTK